MVVRWFGHRLTSKTDVESLAASDVAPIVLSARAAALLTSLA